MGHYFSDTRYKMITALAGSVKKQLDNADDERAKKGKGSNQNIR